MQMANHTITEKLFLKLTWQAVVTEHDILASGTGLSHSSDQAAELVGLTWACEIAKGQGVTISIN